MKIGIIGTGNIGSTLARKLVAAGHEVRVANSRGVEGVRALAADVGAEPVDIHGAVEGADAVILSIPLPAVAALPKGLFGALPKHAPLIDTGNYYPGMRDPNIAAIDEGMTESVWVSGQLGRPVTKAFNNILAHSLAALGKPKGQPGRLAVAVAGDDGEAKAIASGIVDDVGFDAVDAGSLEDSWRIQPSTPAYCCDFDASEMQRAIAAARKGEAPSKRDRMMSDYGSRLGPDADHAAIVALNRELNAPSR